MTDIIDNIEDTIQDTAKNIENEVTDFKNSIANIPHIVIPCQLFDDIINNWINVYFGKTKYSIVAEAALNLFKIFRDNHVYTDVTIAPKVAPTPVTELAAPDVHTDESTEIPEHVS